MRTLPKLVLSGIAIAAAASASADTDTVLVDPVTVNLSAWTYGSGNAVNVGSPTYSGQGGGFSGVLSNAGAYNDASFETYCVELGQSFNWNVSYTNYQIVKGDTYSLWAGNPATAGQIGQLMTYVGTLGALDSAKSTGVQLAIWELIYETGSSYSLSSGTFQNTPSSSNAYADSLLSAFSSTTSMYNVDVLKNKDHQDFLILTAVPEPQAYALALAGLALVGVFGRKVRGEKAKA